MSSLIKSLAVSVLQRYLSAYVATLDASNLEISLSTGDATLEHLELRREALDALDLPVVVRGGYLARVKINIPWTAIKSQPASIEIDGLYLLAGPRDDDSDAGANSEADYKRRQQSNKQKRLALAEMTGGGYGGDGGGAAAQQPAQDGFTARLLALVLNNLQVRVSHVHMRYEDARTTPERPFVCGLTLESFHGVTTDAQGTPAFVHEAGGVLHKLVELRNFALYWNARGEPLQFTSGLEMGAALNALIHKGADASVPPPAALQYLLRPVSGKLRLTMQRDQRDLSMPQYFFDFVFEHIHVVLRDAQYRDFAALAEGFRLHARRAPYMSLARPAERPQRGERARQWWHYALRAVQLELREERAKWSWPRMLERKQSRVRYIVLYCDLKRDRLKPDSDRAKALAALEEQLSYEDILMYRALAHALLKRDDLSGGARRDSGRIASPTNVVAESSPQQQQQGYLGWMVGWAYSGDASSRNSGSASSSAATATAADEDISPKLLSELYATLDYDDSKPAATAAAASLPQEYVRRVVAFALQQGSIELHDDNGCAFTVGTFSDMQCRLESCIDSHTFSASLRSIHLDNNGVPIISRRSVGGGGADGGDADRVWTMTLRVNPLESPHDYALEMRVRPLTFLFSRPYTKALVGFFVRQRQGGSSAWLDLQNYTGAAAQIEALQRQAANQLRETLDHKRSVDISIQVDAPQIFVPEDVRNRHCSVLTVRLDSLRIGSVMQQRVEPQVVTKELVESSPDLFYDRFTLDVASFDLAMVSAVSAAGWQWEEFERCRGASKPVVDPFALQLTLMHCLVDLPYMAAFKLTTSVPALRAHLSPKLFLAFVTAMRTVISDDEEEAAVDASMVGPSAMVPFNDQEILSLAEHHPGLLGYTVDRERARKLQATFEIGAATMLVHHEKTRSNVAELVMGTFSVNVAKLAREMHLSVFLQSLLLVDLQQGGNLLSTEEAVTLRFLSTHRDAAAFAGVDYEVDFLVKDMHCLCNRETVANLIDSGNDILDGMAATAPPAVQESKRLAKPGSGAPGLFLKTRFRMSGLRVTFARGTEAFAEARIDSWDQVMCFRNDDTWSLDVRFKAATVTDLRAHAQRWATVLELAAGGSGSGGVDAAHSLHFTFETLPAAADAGAASCTPLSCHAAHVARPHNMLLTLTVSGMRYVYMQNFVTEWIRYFVEIHSMQQMVAASYARAAGLAVNPAAAEQLMCYRVHLHSPCIQVPRAYDTTGFVFVDLGEIQLGNHFCYAMPASAAAAAAEPFAFVRAEYSMARMNVALSEDGSDAHRRELLREMTLTLSREEPEHPGTAGPQFPEARWALGCSAIRVALSQSQLAFIGATVRENLVADAQNEATRTAYKDFQFTPLILPPDETTLGGAGGGGSGSSSSSRRSSTSGMDRSGSATSLLVVDDGGADDAPLVYAPWIAREIHVKLDRIQVDMFEGSGVTAAGAPATMVSFDVHSLVVHMTTDSTGHAISEYDLQSVTLLDVRHHTVNRFPRTLSSKSAGRQELHLTQVSYTNGDREFMLTMEHPRIVLLPWAYRDLWGFVWPMFESALASWDMWVNDGEVAVPVTPAAQQLRPEWTFRVTITDPEIVLVTNAAVAASEALLLKGTVLFKHYEPPHGGHIRSVHARQLEVFRCFLTDDDNAALADSASSVNMVEPTDITLMHEWMPDKMREKWSLQVEPMNFTISYHDFRMLSALYTYWFPPATVADASAAPAAAAAAAVSPPVSALHYLDAEEHGAPDTATATIQTVYKLATQGTLVRLVNDFYVGNVPVALVALPMLSVRISQTADNFKVMASATFVTEVFNDVAQAWEPVVEPFSADVSYTYSAQAGMRASCTADSVLNVNLTEASIAMLMRTWRDLSADFYRADDERVQSETFRTLSAPYVVRNDTGASVWIWRVDEEGDVVEAPIHGYEVPLPEKKSLQPSSTSHSRYRLVAKRAPASVCIKIAGDLRVARNYPIHDVGCHILKVDPEDRIKLVLQISNQKGGKLLHVRSNVRFCNATETALELQGQTAHVGSVTLTVLAPGAVYALPLAFLRNGRIRVRPAGDKRFDWSAQSISVATIKPTSALMLCPPVDASAAAADYALFCVMDPRVEDPGAKLVPTEDEHSVTFCAPLVLDNLLGVKCAYRLVLAERPNDIVLTGVLTKGEATSVHLDLRQRMMLSIRLPDFRWSPARGILGVRAAHSIDLVDGTGAPLSVELNYLKYPSGLTKLSLFTQFWLINRTGIPLIYSQHSFNSRAVAAGQIKSIKSIQMQESAGERDAQAPRGEEDIALDSQREITSAPVDAAANDNNAPAVVSGVALSVEAAADRPDAAAGSSVFGPDLFRPLMFSPEKMGRKLSFRAAGTHWTEPFSISAPGASEFVSLPQVARKRSMRGLYQFEVTVERGPGKFWRTRTVTVKPRIVLVNNAQRPLLCCQRECNAEIRLDAGQQRPFHWTDSSRDFLLAVCFAEYGWNWSAGFSLVANHKITIKARNLRGQTALLKVRTVESDGTLVVIFDEEHPEFPTYRIINASMEPVIIHQYLALPHVYEEVAPGAAIAYAWDDPGIRPLLLEVVTSAHDEKILLDLDTLGLFNSSDPQQLLQLDGATGLGHFYGVVTAVGPSRVATIKLNDSALPFPSDGVETSRRTKFVGHLSLRGIGVSVVNRSLQELVYVSASSIDFNYEDNRREQQVEFSVGHLQVDNQSFVTQFPVLLWTRPKMEKFLSVSLVRSADYTSVHFIKKMSAFVDHMDVCMDDAVFLRLWDFMANVGRAIDAPSTSAADSRSAAAATGVASASSAMDVGEPHGSVGKYFTVPTHNLRLRQIYLQELHLSGFNLLVSFINTDTNERGELGETELSRIISTYGALANIERAPISLAPLSICALFLSRTELVDLLWTHYLTGVRRGLAKILASADFLGAPMALAGHVREGARDLVELPRRGAARQGAKGAIAGFAKGSASFAKSVGYGTFNSVAKVGLSGTIGESVSELAMDQTYEEQREKLGRQRPQHAGEGVLYGARDLGLGLFRGLSGVIVEPVRGAREDGVRGFFTGISRGITGLYVKPAVGVVDLFTRSAEGIRNTAAYWDEGQKSRVRLPRFIGVEGVLQVFQKQQAEGQWILYSLAAGRFLEEREYYRAHFTTGVNTLLMVTDLSLVQVQGSKVDWCVAIAQIDKLVVEPKVYNEGILVVFKRDIVQPPRKICCVHGAQNFSSELLKILTTLLLHHQVGTADMSVIKRRSQARASPTTTLESLLGTSSDGERDPSLLGGD